MRIAFVIAVVSIAALAACKSELRPTISDALRGPIAEMKLTRGEWITVVVEPYRGVYDEYARAFDAAAPAIAAQFAASQAKKKSMLVTRQHYAGDPALTRGQARARWALPVQAPADVAVLDDAPIDAVFVRVGNGYRAIVGVDQIVVEKTRALDEACAHYLDTLGNKACQTIGWEIADAALRADKPRLEHACSLARSQCAGP